MIHKSLTILFNVNYSCTNVQIQNCKLNFEKCRILKTKSHFRILYGRVQKSVKNISHEIIKKNKCGVPATFTGKDCRAMLQHNVSEYYI